MTFEDFIKQSQYDIANKITLFKYKIQNQEDQNFMKIWGSKFVVLNDGGYRGCGRVVGCQSEYDFSTNTLSVCVQLEHCDGSLTISPPINNIAELSNEQYAIYELKHRIAEFPWDKEHEMKYLRIIDLIDQLDVYHIVSTPDENEESN